MNRMNANKTVIRVYLRLFAANLARAATVVRLASASGCSWRALALSFNYRVAHEQAAAKIPKFASEAEEAEWWDAHRDEVGNELVRAMQAGRAQVLTRDRLLERLTDSKDPNRVVIALSTDDRTRLHQLAELRGLDDGEYAKQLLVEALRSARP